MKKGFILLALTVISLSAVCQTKKKTAETKKPAAIVEHFQDSTGMIISDTDRVISIRDIQTFNVLLSKIPHDQYMSLSPNDAVREFYLWIMQRYKKPSTDPKK